MPDPSPRKRFQIHLSTAIVMMFVAGALMWVNSRGRLVGSHGLILGSGWPKGNQSEGSEAQFERNKDGENWFGKRLFNYGWPCDLLYTSVPAASTRIDQRSPHMDWLLRDPYVKKYISSPTKSWRGVGIIINLLAAVPVLVSAGFVCEWLIRSRAARKGS